MSDAELAEHPAVTAWQRLAGSHSTPEKVEPLDKPSGRRNRHRPVFRLTGMDTPHATVIAKRCKRVQAERELRIYQEILPQLPLTSPQAFGCIAGGRGKNDTWLFLEEVRGVPYDPTQARHRELAGRWLAVLHTSAARARHADELNDQGPNHFSADLATIRTLLRHARVNPALAHNDLEVLQQIGEQCDVLAAAWREIERYLDHFTPTMVQGDFKEPHIRLRETALEGMIAFDWADAGWAVPAVDLAKFIGYSVEPDLDAYLSVAKTEWPSFDAPTIRRLGYVGEIFRWLATVRWHAEDLRYEWLDRPMSRMRLYHQWMREILELAPWRDGEAFHDSHWRPAVRTWY